MTGVLEQLRAGRGASGETAWFVPGRIEVLGKHTDYAGGRSLLAAVDLGHTIRGAVRSDGRVVVRTDAAGDAVEIGPEIAPDRAVGEPAFGGGSADADAVEPAEVAAKPTTSVPDALPEGHWGGYVRTAVARLRANFPGRVAGADLQLSSTLPLAAGMSSSSALVVAIALALLDLSDLAHDPACAPSIRSDEDLAGYLGAVENGSAFGDLPGTTGVGTFGGSQDHTAMLCGREGALVQYAFAPVRRERVVTMPDGLALLVAVSGVEAAKTGAAREAFNAVSLRVGELLRRWHRATGRTDPTLAAALASGPDALLQMRALAGEDALLHARLDQFVEESDRIIPAAASALEREDLTTFGRLVDLSQRGAEHGLGNQVPETVALQRGARELGAHAASAFGAGFGGAVWALVDAASADEFAHAWRSTFAARFPERADAARVIPCRPGPPARRCASMSA